jgi:hypothetical protein
MIMTAFHVDCVIFVSVEFESQLKCNCYTTATQKLTKTHEQTRLYCCVNSNYRVDCVRVTYLRSIAENFAYDSSARVTPRKLRMWRCGVSEIRRESARFGPWGLWMDVRV